MVATIKKEEAVDRLTQFVNVASEDDLVEIYNELFPEEPTTEEATHANQNATVDKIKDHMMSGLEVEEILDLWNVIFPADRAVWFDEDEGVMHYNEKVEHVRLVD